MTSRLRQPVTLLLCGSMVACGAGWRSLPTPWPADIAPTQQVQVWSQQHALQLHGVRLSTDSITGIPFHRPLDCDSCRVALSRRQVDSLRVGNPTSGFWKSAGLVGLGLWGLAAIICVSSGGCDSSD